VKAYVRTVRGCGGPISTVIAVGKAVVQKFDANLLSEYGGPLSLTPSWAKSILYRMNFVKRKYCSQAKPMVHGFEEIKAQFLGDVLAVVKIESIPDELVLNWDHTPINRVVCSGQWPKRELKESNSSD